MDDFRSVRALFWALISRNCVLSRHYRFCRHGFARWSIYRL